MATSATPLEDAIRRKLTDALSPTVLSIANDSAAHAHHTAMAGNTSRETHFRVTVVSDEFKAKPQPARHRMVYRLLGDELASGVHALQLRTRTIDEEEKSQGSDKAGDA